MGLYDSFWLKKPIECPLCHAKKDSGIQEFQTKELGGQFYTFKIGEKAESNHFILKDGKYDIYSSCDKCKAWITAEAVIKNGIFASIVDIKSKPKKEWFK
jgi:hypothetical protein